MFKSNGGFTLVELIVVIAILGVLATITIPAYTTYVTKAQEKVEIYQETIDDEEAAVEAAWDAAFPNG